MCSLATLLLLLLVPAPHGEYASGGLEVTVAEATTLVVLVVVAAAMPKRWAGGL